MMATVGPSNSCSFLPLLESLEDRTAGQSEQIDAYLTIANRLNGEEARQFLPAVEQHFSRLGKVTLVHITSPNVELSQAALQALGFCVYHSRVVSGVPETFASEILSALCSLVVKSTDKNTCTRALWVISKQSFPAETVAKNVLSILDTLESVWSRQDIQSAVMEHEALNVVIRMLEQVPAQMGDAAVRWVKFVMPLVVHSASKVRLRAAATVEMGMPLLLEKQAEVAAIIEPTMSSKLIPELQKLFMSKNETNVLKLWPLFVKLLGKLLHKGGPFINSLLHLEELGFRSSSFTIKKIAFLAWKSLIDNFALNPDILCSGKRMKLLLQPLTSIHVRTEALMLTKVEVWWYLIVQLGPNLSSNFDQVSGPLLQCTFGTDSSVPGTPSRPVSQNGTITPGTSGFNSLANTSRVGLNSNIQIPSTFPTIQLLGLEMLLHYFLGPEVTVMAAKNKFILSLEPLKHPLLSSISSFTKHSAVLISNLRDGFISIGKDAPESLLAVLWKSLTRFVTSTIESAGTRKDRHGCEVLTLMLQALQSIITSEALPADKVLILFEATVKGIPQRVLGSASYQVGKMDVLNGTPALFLILLLYNSPMLAAYIEDERFFQCLQTLVGCGLSGPTSPLAFVEAVLGAISRSAGSLQNKEQLWRTWNVVVSPLTDTITQSNEVNQGDALEHNFSAMYIALLFPITYLLRGTPLQQVTQKSMLSSWSKVYKVFARCSALVVTAEENICCEELCAKMTASIDREALMVPSTLNAIASILQVMVECMDFSPYTPQVQQKLKSPHTPLNWVRKRNKVLGNLFTFQSLLVQCLQVYLEDPDTSSDATGMSLVSILSVLFTNLTLAATVKEVLTSLIGPLTVFYKHAASEPPRMSFQLLGKLEKLLSDVLGCLQTRATLAFDDELLAQLSPLLCILFLHKSKLLRTSTTHFWNSTFANSVSLTYPDEIRQVLSQVKQKTPIILPGFEVIGVPDEFSGNYSNESSQLETKLSGLPVSSLGKRDSLPGKATELKEKTSMGTTKPFSSKLDFGSPMPPRREVLEEEASIDFVFIPPETKERVLTEHQKEVKRTKRFDIPAMYNNLDASLDTTVFTHYTQSQEDSLEKLPAEQAENTGEVVIDKGSVENGEDTEHVTKDTQDYSSIKVQENMKDNEEQEKSVHEAADVSKKDDSKSNQRAEDLDLESQGTSPDIACSSDLVSGTPQKASSRRQSFITLEKYSDGKPASPGTDLAFTGLLIKSTNSQEHNEANKFCSSLASHSSASPNSPDSLSTGKRNSQCCVNDAPESPLRPKESLTKCEPVRLTERMSSDSTEEDIIPDTQTEVEGKQSAVMDSTLLDSSSQETEASQQNLDDSQQSPMTQTCLREPRRSGRNRVPPLLPGEDPEVRAEKYMQFKRKCHEDELKNNSSQSSSLQNRPKTRRQTADEDNGTHRLRTRSQRDQIESSQTNSHGRVHKKIKLSNNSEELLNKPKPRRRTRESTQTDLRPDTEPNYQHLAQDRYSSQRIALLDNKEEGGKKKDFFTNKQESSQTDTVGFVQQTEKTESKKDNQLVTHSLQMTGNNQKFLLVTETEDENPNEDSLMTTHSLQMVDQSQEDIRKPTNETDSQIVTSSPISNKSFERTSPANKSINHSEFKKLLECRDETLNQVDSEEISSSDSQSLRRSRRSKVSAEPTEFDQKGKNKDSVERQSRASSQGGFSPPGHAETTVGGRTRRSKAEVQPKSNSLSSQGNSQPLNTAESESSKGRGRYSRRLSQTLAANIESSESESSEPRENVPVPNKRGRKHKTSLQGPLTHKTIGNDSDMLQNDTSHKTDVQNMAHINQANLHDSQKTQVVQASESHQLVHNIEDQTEMEFNVVRGKTETKNALSQKEQKEQDANSDNILHETDSTNLQSTEKNELVGVQSEQTQEKMPCNLSRVSAETISSPVKMTEEMWASDEKTEVCEPEDDARENQNDLHYQGQPDQTEAGHSASNGEKQMECSKSVVYFSKEEELSASTIGKNQSTDVSEETAPLQQADKINMIQTGVCQDEEQTQATNAENSVNVSDVLNSPALDESTSKDTVQVSPTKELATLMGPDVSQSPSSGRIRGTWSPSASPSTSILKKGQKRPLEDETPSPLVKSRRVSFADPIQQQETADDIDRRSPVIRTSSPRKSKNTSISQPKYVTTPTKGLLILSPRNLQSPGHKSSKKCLISEMNQMPRPVSRDCIYPALVSCSAPVEAVLPQISSNMWSRGFGQLVRARNIKTVGDLSALTPNEIKSLPIRSPKVSNVKKALKNYEQQRKGRGADELKSFDETEMMTSELEETSAPQNQDEEDKTSGEMLAIELLDEPVPADCGLKPEGSGNETVETEQRLDGQLHPDGRLLPQLEVLNSRMMPSELHCCSAQQLVQIHDTLGDLMKRVVAELQARVCQTDGKL